MKIKNIGIVGDRGNIGGSLTRILEQHPFTRIVYAESSKEKEGDMAEAEFVFLALPDGLSEKYLPFLEGKMVIDHSIDHRSEWVYGLPEISQGKIPGSKKIAMPGCWATASILGLYPLKGRIKWATVSGVSGISGTPKKEVSKEDNIKSYKAGRIHQQIPEIERAIGFDNLIFSPAVAENTFRGLITTVTIQTDLYHDDLVTLYAESYAECPFVRIIEAGIDVETRNVIQTNFCDIKIMQFGKDIVIISALDNLIKGGAGQAVQNFNLMCGFPETTGLV